MPKFWCTTCSTYLGVSQMHSPTQGLAHMCISDSGLPAKPWISSPGIQPYAAKTSYIAQGDCSKMHVARSMITFASGARQLVVQEAFDTMSSVLGLYLSSLTPMTNMGASACQANTL
jgi:hypothetical protein